MAIKYDESKGDVRVKRTRKNLRRAFLERCQEVPFDKIQVTEIAQAAGIDRKTFYLHFNKLEDLEDDVENNIAAEVLEQFSEGHSDEDIAGNIYALYSYLEEHPVVMQPLLSDYTYDHFGRKFRHDILNAPSFKALYGTDPAEARLAEGYCSCIFSIYGTWVRTDGTKPQLKDLADRCAKLVLHGYKGIRSTGE